MPIERAVLSIPYPEVEKFRTSLSPTRRAATRSDMLYRLPRNADAVIHVAV